MLQIYKNIKARRIELGMTQQELAEKTGYSSKSAIARIEAGQIKLPLPKIELFAKALHTTGPDLMGYEPNDGYYFSDEVAEIAQELYDQPHLKTLFDASRKLSVEDIKAIQNMVDLLYQKEHPED